MKFSISCTFEPFITLSDLTLSCILYCNSGATPDSKAENLKYFPPWRQQFYLSGFANKLCEFATEQPRSQCEHRNSTQSSQRLFAQEPNRLTLTRLPYKGLQKSARALRHHTHGTSVPYGFCAQPDLVLPQGPRQ